MSPATPSSRARATALVALALAATASAGAKPTHPTPLDQVGVTVPGAWIPGLRSNDLTSRSLGGAGDVNGDGCADFLIGAPQGDPFGLANGGFVYLVHGGAGALAPVGHINLGLLDGVRGVRLEGATAGGRAGQAVAGVGDLDGDGLDEVLVGAPATNASPAQPGSAYLVYGRAPWRAASLSLGSLSSPEAVRIRGLGPGDRCGVSVAGAGDVNGDGVPDFLVGASHADPNGFANAGEVYLIYGRATGLSATGEIRVGELDGTNGVRFQGVLAGDRLGIAVAGAGDVNGDGLDDILLGAQDSDIAGSDSGVAYLIYGSSEPIGAGGVQWLGALTPELGTRLDPADAQDAAGTAVSAAGDANGDGFADLLVGAPEADPQGITTGEAYLVHGRPGGLGSGGTLSLAGLDGSSGVRLQGIAQGDRLGEALAGTGDLTGDGLSELLLGAPMTDRVPPDTGDGYLLFGSTVAPGTGGVFALAGLGGLTGLRLDGVTLAARTGQACGAAGDVNGDGLADLLIGAPQETVGTIPTAGQATLLLGWPSTLVATARGHQRGGAAPRRGVGALGGGADPWGPVRAAIAFDAGDAPSLQTVTFHRTAPGGTWTPPAPAPMHWEIATDRAGWTSAEVTLHYTPQEVLGWDERTLTVFRADSPAGPWSPVATTVDAGRNEVSAAGLTELGAFALGGAALSAEALIQHLLGVAVLPASLADTADVNRDGGLDMADVVWLLNRSQ